MRVALKFAYIGMSYHGFARQPHVKTVEGSLINILIQQEYIKDPKSSMFRCASRTDKGVSALGNVIAFNTEKNVNSLLKKCNKELENIIIYAIKNVDNDFYPRYAKLRVYRYFLIKNIYDFKELKKLVNLFEGTHDFSNFARIENNKNPIRTIDKIAVDESDCFYYIDFFAQTYLWHQIRRIISALIQVLKQKTTQEEIIDALNNPNKKIDFSLAQAEPLILTDIIYDFSFDVDPKCINKKNEMENHLINEIKCLF
jgi:tRNA pseudouridine38-40 synthase